MIRHKRIKRGKGVIDFLKPLVNKAIENKDDVVKIGQNTRDIIKEIKTKKSTDDEISSIVNRINKLRVGSGFAYI